MTAKPRQKRRPDVDRGIIQAIACGSTKMDAARINGCAVRTVDRRMADPEFRKKVEAFRSDVLSSAAGKLASAAGKAVSTLEELLGSKSESIRLGASRAILDSVIKITELTKVESRVQALEELFRSGGTGNSANRLAG